MHLVNKRALVTGAGKRIGKAIAVGLAKAGADVVVHYSSSKDGAKEVAAEIRKIGRRVELIQCDLASAEGPAQLAKATLNAFGGLDILINNASVYSEPGKWNAEKNILQETLADWELSLNVNARAPFFLIQALAPALKQALNQQGSGCVVNILDQSISTPFYSRASHSVSKTALAMITKLAAETLSPAVRVVGLELGKILPPEGLPEAEFNKCKWIGAEAVVDAVLSVLKDDSINGEIIPVI